jgi:hypothetical protein
MVNGRLKFQTFLDRCFIFQGRSDKGPAKDIITMMREFQAENERRRTSIDTNASMLLNADSNEMILQSISNDQSAPSTPTKQRHVDQQIKTGITTKNNTSERRSNVDRNKFNTKTNRFASDNLKVRYFNIINKINYPLF